MQGDASLGRGIVRARDVEENRRSSSGRDRRVVVAEHHDEVVDLVVAPQVFGARRIGQPDRLVVGRVGRRVAPAVGRGQGRGRQTGRRRRHPVGSVKQSAHGPQAGRRGAVALPFRPHRRDSAATERAPRLARRQKEDAVGIDLEVHRHARPCRLAARAGRCMFSGHGAKENHPDRRRRRRPSRAAFRTAPGRRIRGVDRQQRSSTASRRRRRPGPILVLMDLDLPDINGREASRRLREAGRRVADHHADRRRRRRRTRFRAWRRAPATMSPSRSSFRCSSPGSAPSFAPTSSRRMRPSPSGRIRSSRRTSCWSTPRASACASPTRRPTS